MNQRLPKGPPMPLPMQQPRMNMEANTIHIKFWPSEDFLNAVLKMGGSEEFKVITEEFKARVGQMAFASCIINDEKVSKWVQGRVQELQEICIVFDKARDILAERKKSDEQAKAASKAMM